MKRIISLVLAVLMVASCMTIGVFAAYETGTYKPSTSDGCNIRSGASTSYSVVGAIAYGTTFVVTKVSGAWGYTTYNNVSGWVCLDYADLAGSSDSGNSTTDMATFNSKLDEFKKRYPDNSTYIDNPGLTGGYECFGYANELALYMFGSYPTNSMQATVVNSGWTRTYGGNSVDNLCAGDIVRYHMHSIFITNIIGDTIYFCEALGDAGNKVRYDQTISRSILKNYVSATLWHDNATTTGWVAHYNNGLSVTPSTTITYSDIVSGVYQIHSDNSYLTAPVDTSTQDEGGDISASASNGQKTQFFEISKSGSAYMLTARSSTSGKVVNIYRDGTASSGDNVTLYKSTGDSTQLWLFEPQNGAYVIRSYNNPSLALTINGSDINVSTCTYSSNQLWKLSVPDDNRNWSDWSEWSSTKVDSSNAKDVQTKTVYRYYHYILMYSNGNCGAYPIKADDFNRFVPGYAVTQKAYHEDIYSDYQLTKVDSLTYDKAYNCYENIHCSSDYNFSTNANYVYYLGTETWYRHRDLQYTIKFDANGGTGAPAAQTKTHDVTLTLSSTKPTRLGYNFKGWATTQGGAVEYAPGASFTTNSDTTLYAVWEVATVPVTGVTLNNTSATLTEGDTLTLTATVAPTNATNKNVTWSSSDTSVATVSSSGVVTARKAGTVTITVTTVDGNRTATCAVTVKAKTVPVTGVTLSNTSATLTEGDTLALTATVAPTNATNKNVTWSSSDTSVATVSSSGVVTALKAGSATITATTEDGSKTASCKVTVKAAYDPNALTFTLDSVKAVAGKTVTVDLVISNNTGFAGTSLFIEYDRSVMKMIGYSFAGWEGTSNFDQDPEYNPVGFSWIKPTNYNKNGVLVSLTFEINNDAPIGEYELILSNKFDVANENIENVEYNLVNGKITVIDYKPGDTNGDGEINATDAVLLAQYLAKWSVEMNPDAADTNGDGTVNAADAVLLAQYLAKWDVTLG